MPRASFAACDEALAALVTLVSLPFACRWTWTILAHSGVGVLVFVSPVFLGALLLLWRYWTEARRHPAVPLALLLCLPLAVCLFGLPQFSGAAGPAPTLGRLPRALVLGLCYGGFGLLCRWCFTRLHRLLRRAPALRDRAA